MLGRFIPLLIAVAVGACAGADSPTMHAQAMASLGDKLRAGGYTIYLRHAHTDPGADKDLRNLSNCAAQRNLSAKGREQAKQIGEILHGSSIGIGAVRSSPFCRTIETARLAMGRTSQLRELMFHADMSQAERDEGVKALAKLLGRRPPPGLNTLLVGHSPPIEVAMKDNGPKAPPDKPYVDEGEAVVVQPTDQGYQFVAFIRAGDWPLLASRAK